MIIKALICATVAVAAMNTASFAQDAGNVPADPPTQGIPTVNHSDDDIPPGFVGNGYGTNSHGDFTLNSRLQRSTNVATGACFWSVRVEITYSNGDADWKDYSTKIPCDQPAPSVTGILPPQPDEIKWVSPTPPPILVGPPITLPYEPKRVDPMPPPILVGPPITLPTGPVLVGPPITLPFKPRTNDPSPSASGDVPGPAPHFDPSKVSEGARKAVSGPLGSEPAAIPSPAPHFDPSKISEAARKAVSGPLGSEPAAIKKGDEVGAVVPPSMDKGDVQQVTKTALPRLDTTPKSSKLIPHHTNRVSYKPFAGSTSFVASRHGEGYISRYEEGSPLLPPTHVTPWADDRVESDAPRFATHSPMPEKRLEPRRAGFVEPMSAVHSAGFGSHFSGGMRDGGSMGHFGSFGGMGHFGGFGGMGLVGLFSHMH